MVRVPFIGDQYRGATSRWAEVPPARFPASLVTLGQASTRATAARPTDAEKTGYGVACSSRDPLAEHARGEALRRASGLLASETVPDADSEVRDRHLPEVALVM